MNRCKNATVAGKDKPLAGAKLHKDLQKKSAATSPANKMPQPKANAKKTEHLPSKTVQRTAVTRKSSERGCGGMIGGSGSVSQRNVQSKSVSQAAKATRSEAHFRIGNVDEPALRRGTSVRLQKLVPKNLKRLDLEVVTQLPQKATKQANQLKPSKIPLNVNRRATTDYAKDADNVLRVMHAHQDTLRMTDESELDTKDEKAQIDVAHDDCGSNKSDEDAKVVILKEPPQELKPQAKAEAAVELEPKTDVEQEETAPSKEVNGVVLQVNANTTQNVLATAAVAVEQQAENKIEHLKPLVKFNMSKVKLEPRSSNTQVRFTVPAITIKPGRETVWNAASIKPQWSGLIRQQTLSHSMSEDSWYTPRADVLDINKTSSAILHMRSMGKRMGGDLD